MVVALLRTLMNVLSLNFFPMVLLYLSFFYFTVHNGNCLLVLCFVSFCSSEWLDCLMVGSGNGRTDVVQLQVGPG